MSCWLAHKNAKLSVDQRGTKSPAAIWGRKKDGGRCLYVRIGRSFVVRVTWRETEGHVGAFSSSVGALSREVEEVTGQAWSPRLDCAGGGRALESAGEQVERGQLCISAGKWCR